MNYVRFAASVRTAGSATTEIPLMPETIPTMSREQRAALKTALSSWCKLEKHEKCTGGAFFSDGPAACKCSCHSPADRAVLEAADAR